MVLLLVASRTESQSKLCCVIKKTTAWQFGYGRMTRSPEAQASDFDGSGLLSGRHGSSWRPDLGSVIHRSISCAINKHWRESWKIVCHLQLLVYDFVLEIGLHT